MRSFECVLTQSDWCPYKKEEIKTQHTQREDHVKALEEDGHLQRGETILPIP